MNRALALSALAALLAGCFNFDALERTARCRRGDPNVTDCAAEDAGAGGGGQPGGDAGGGAGGGVAPTDFDDAFTDGGLEVSAFAVTRGAASSRTKTLEARGLDLTWGSESCELDAGLRSGCLRTWELSGGFVDLKNHNPAVYTYTDLPLSSAVGQRVAGGGQPLAYLNALTDVAHPTIDLGVDPRDARGFGGFTSPWSAPYSGAVAWVGQRRFVALFPYAAGTGLTLWSYDYDATDGGRAETPSPPLDSCAVRVDDAVTALAADGGPTGVAWFSAWTSAACGILPAGPSLVRVDGSEVSAPDAGLGASSLRLAARNGHLWAASEAVGGGFELRSFDVGGASPVSAFERPLRLAQPGDWAQVDVTADSQGRPYVVGNSSTGVQVASFELDGGLRFALPVPGTTEAHAVAAAWTSRGLAIAGDCAAQVTGVCAPDAGTFLVLVRVPRSN